MRARDASLPAIHFRRVARDTASNVGTLMAAHTVGSLAECGRMCTSNVACASFAHSQANAECLEQWVDFEDVYQVNDDSFKDQTILSILLCRRVRFHPHASTSGTIVIAGNCVPTHADGENTTSSNNFTTVENGAQEDERDRTGIYIQLI